MKSRTRLEARSGLKPLGMLLSCLFLFGLIAGRVVHKALSGGEVEKRDVVTKTHVLPRYDVLDRNERTIATDEGRSRLEMSPNSMWQAHTPGRIVHGIHELLETENQIGEEALMDLVLPGSKDGVIRVMLPADASDGGKAVERFLDPATAKRLDDWLITGVGERSVPVSGMWLEHASSENGYRICWMPEVLLSESTREAQGYRQKKKDGGYTDHPSTWCRQIARRLAPFLGLDGSDAMTARREVWKRLMPSTYRVVLPRLSSTEAWRIRKFLRAEGVSEGQMKLVDYRERVYPVAYSEASYSEVQRSDLVEAGWDLLGSWSYLGREDSTRVVLRRHGVGLDEEERMMKALDTIALLIARSDGVRAQTLLYELDHEVVDELLEIVETIAISHSEREGVTAKSLIAALDPGVGEELMEVVDAIEILPSDREGMTEGMLWLAALHGEVEAEILRKAPRGGLELSSQRLFEQEEFRELLAMPEEIDFHAYRPAQGAIQRYFQWAVEEDETPRVLTTLDAPLQNFLHRKLEELLAEHDAALAMGIVVDVNTGEILAIDGVSQYELAMFLPLQYGFTPGSTFKPITATAALDLKVVSPDQRFRTFDRSIHLGQFVKGSNRTIGEARNSELGVDGRLSLREGLAHSINAVMVQVGLKMPIEHHRSIVIELGYGQSRQTELGMVAAGKVSPYKEWKNRAMTQASVSIGHEIQCTLWQHAEGLLTIIHGGERLPLRVLRSVECRDKKRPISAMAPRAVFANASCEEVRGMMRLAARIGTGERLYEELLAKGISLVWGGKTGTTQKPDDIACAHIELACVEENVERRRNGQPLLNCTHEGKVGTPPHSRDCYTASMMVFGSVGDPRGSLPLAGEEREVMVIIVVEEPRGSQYYGSQIAGPAAIALLLEAQGLTHDGQLVEELVPPTQSVPEIVTRSLSEDPVREIPVRYEEGGR